MNKKILIALLILIPISTATYFGITMFTKQTAPAETKQTLPKEDNLEKQKDIFVYETEVDSEEDCTSFETFNEENSTCFFECETEQECSEISSTIDDELDSWTEDIEQRDFSSEQSGDYEYLATYDVSRGETIELTSGETSEIYEELWNEVSEISPDFLSDKYIESFEIFDVPTDDVVAFVDDSDANGKWRIAFNITVHTNSTVQEQKSTIIHELSHILSLNSSQIEISNNCKTYQLDEGCAKESSYINAFWQTFWKDQEISEYSEEQFVSEYAATSEAEDFSESFAFFVLEKDKLSLGNSTRDEKVKFFYNFPELVEIREDIRSVLSRDIIRAKRNTGQ